MGYENQRAITFKNEVALYRGILFVCSDWVTFSCANFVPGKKP